MSKFIGGFTREDKSLVPLLEEGECLISGANVKYPIYVKIKHYDPNVGSDNSLLERLLT
jgi:hypothetical protein